jgi:hypothetical protein
MRWVGKPIFGRAIDTQTFQGPVLLAALRYAGSANTRSTALALQATHATLQRVGGSVVVSIEGRLDAARDLVTRHRLLFPVLFDSEGSLHGVVGSNRNWAGMFRMRPGQMLRRVANFHIEPGALSGPMDRLPAAALVLDGVPVWHWHARSVTDVLPVNEVDRHRALR